MNKLLAYLRCRRTLLVFYALAVLVTLLVPALSGGSMENARYAALLMSFALAVLLTADGCRFFRRRRALALLLERTDTALSDGMAALPEPADALEADYQALLLRQNGACCALRARMDREKQEQLGYYALWVHQIKTPIAAMRLVLQSRGGADADGVLLRELFQIEQYADLALRYSKLTDIADDLVIETCDVGAVVHESVKKFALPIVYQKLSLSVAPMAYTLKSDRRWLGFIIEQVVSNAVKYTKAGGVTVTLAGNALTVADTGVGIRSEDLPRIFERGYTGYNGRVDTRASGVGLYLAKRAADALGVCFSVSSKLGEGTQVTLLLPDQPDAGPADCA